MQYLWPFGKRLLSPGSVQITLRKPHAAYCLCFIVTSGVRTTTGGYVFRGICLLRGMGHHHPIILPLVPCPFQGVPHLHPIIVLLVPGSFLGGTPIRDGWDTAPHQGLDWVLPPPLSGNGWHLTAYATGGTPLVVSRRRTFLFLKCKRSCGGWDVSKDSFRTFVCALLIFMTYVLSTKRSLWVTKHNSLQLANFTKSRRLDYTW